MPNTETLRVPLWDGLETSKLIGQRVFDSVAGEIALADTITDDFSDSNLAGDLWSAKTAGGGTVSETTQLDLDSTVVADASFVIYKKTPTDFRARTAEYKIKFSINSASTGSFIFQTTQKTTEPEPGIWNSSDTGKFNIHVYRRQSDGKIVFRYIDDESTLIYHNATFFLVLNTTYVMILETTPTAWRFILKNADESITHVTTSWVNWADCYDDGNKDWISLGDMFTDFNYVDWTVYYASFSREYPADSPSPGEQWKDLPVSSIVDMSSIRIPEMMNPGDMGSIKYQYAKNGGALNGAWLTQAQLRAEADITVTDEAESIKIVPRYISDGTQKATSEAYALMDVHLPYAVFQNPLEVVETEDMEVIEL